LKDDILLFIVSEEQIEEQVEKFRVDVLLHDLETKEATSLWNLAKQKRPVSTKIQVHFELFKPT
jgi:hypothetical protein